MIRSPLLGLGLAATLALGACLEDTSAPVACGAGGDPFRYGGVDYCIYTGAIIIEGFDCPPELPFGTPVDGVMVCGPTSDAPPAGWDGLVDAWEEAGNRADAGPETSLPDTSIDTGQPDGVETDIGPVDTSDTLEAEVVTPGACLQSLSAGQCWNAEACPSGWVCEGAAPGCTPCGDCPDPVPGPAGRCRPEPAADALGILLWPGATRAEDVLFGVFWIQSTAYTLLECPAFILETADGAGGFTPGPNESGCSAAIAPEQATPIARVAPLPSVRTEAPVRLRGRYRTSCFSADPVDCQGATQLISNELVLPP